MPRDECPIAKFAHRGTAVRKFPSRNRRLLCDVDSRRVLNHCPLDSLYRTSSEPKGFCDLEDARALGEAALNSPPIALGTLGRPSRFPCALARLRPALMRCRIMER